MERFIECTTKIYPGKKMREFINAQEASNNDDLEEWQKAQLQEKLESILPPQPQFVRIYIDPTRILTYTESFSLEESLTNPDYPKYDVVDVYMEDGPEWQIICTIEEFNEKLTKFFSQKHIKK